MNTTTSPIAKASCNLWPYLIIGWFVMFASALAAWIVFATHQKSDLVRVDYYEAEVQFQHQLDRLNRTSAIRNEIDIAYDGTKRIVTLLLPFSHLTPRPTGQIEFYRPANVALDFRLPLAVDETGRQRIGTETLRGGLWKVRVNWSSAGKDYYYEQVIVVNELSRSLAAAAMEVK